MNFLKNKFIIGCFCIVFSVAFGGFIVPVMSERIMSDTVPVVVAQNDIDEGSAINEDDIKVVNFHSADAIPEGYSSSIEDFKSKYAGTFIQKGDVITSSKISESSDDEKNSYIEEISADNNKFAVSVDVSGYNAIVGGNVKIGDVVTILDSHGTSYNEIYYVKIIDITDASGNQPEKTAPSVITFSVNIVQAQKIADLSQNDKVYLLLAARGSEKAAELLSVQASVFENDDYLKDLLESRKISSGE